MSGDATRDERPTEFSATGDRNDAPLCVSDSPTPRFSFPIPLLGLFFRALASLPLAVVLMAGYAAVLAAATFFESRHGAAAARHYVYDAHWFAALHVVLGANVLAALLVRLPWRRRQTGFVVSHAGILVLLAGCAATRFAGLDLQLPVYEGRAAHTAYDNHARPCELGFQIYLHEFRRKLDPGSNRPSHYSSRVDFLDRGSPPRKLRENVEIQLNAPVDFRDPASGRTYRLFQSSFQGPWLPGDPEFDQMVGADRSRDRLFLSRLSLNSDPGRGLKYFGSCMIVVGIALAFYGGRGTRGRGRSSRWKTPSPTSESGNLEPLALNHCSPPPSVLRQAIFSILPSPLVFLGAFVSLAAGEVRAGATDALDWSAWRALPVWGNGRVVPLDTFARDTVEAICGRTRPVLVPPEASPGEPPRRFDAAELLFRWLVEPERWQRVAFLTGDRRLRRDLGLPETDDAGRPLLGLSPHEVETSEPLRQALADARRRAETEKEHFQPADFDRRMDRLMEAYGRFRAVVFRPRESDEIPRRFFACWRQARGAVQRLAGSEAAARRISSDDATREAMIAAVESWRRLTAVLHDEGAGFDRIEPAVAAFRAAAGRLADALGDRPNVRGRRPDTIAGGSAVAGEKEAVPGTKDESQLHSPPASLSTKEGSGALAALAVDLRHRALQLHVALYDDGDTLRLVPALDAGALEDSRLPDDDASPWLGIQTLLYGSEALLAEYPPAELAAARRAFDAVRAAFLDRTAADRPARFSAAMDEFAASLRALGAAVEPLREQLPIRRRDAALIAATAYPPPGADHAELLYNRLDPFFWSWVTGLAAVVLLAASVGRWKTMLFWLGAAALVLSAACTAAGLAFRAYVTGLVPLTGMFETVAFVSFYAGLLGLWFAFSPALFRRGADVPPGAKASRFQSAMERRAFVAAGAIVGFTTAVLAYYAPDTVMRRSLGSVTPILRDNFWLAVHVVTIMASYASAAIALLLGNFALALYLFGRYRPGDCPNYRGAAVENGTVPFKGHGRRPPAACGALAGMIYRAIQITVLLLTAGTILGALWADNAWGRFWGWDPKENWALISLLAYAIILHTRYLGWSGDFGLAVAAVFGFTCILFTWYAVNFVLPSGLHSYGTGAGAGQWAVGGAVAAEWLFLLAAAARRRLEKEKP